MQISRLFGILYYLLEKGRATAPELANKFEVSTRTIYRDVDTISSMGIPIYVTTGRNGGIQFLDDYVLDKSFFSHQEKQEMLSGLQSLPSVQYPQVNNILEKLSAIFQIRLSDWIDVDFSRWGIDSESENLMFDHIKQGIFEKLTISFNYYNASGGIASRNVLPRKLVYKDKAWYLYAFCLSRKDYRLFRLTRIKHLVLTRIPFEQYPKPERSPFPEPHDMGDLIDVELTFASDVGYRLYDLLDDSAITPQPAGYTVKLSLPENGWLYDFLMSFGEKVTIIYPHSLRQKITEKHEAAFAHHRGDMV